VGVREFRIFIQSRFKGRNRFRIVVLLGIHHAHSIPHVCIGRGEFNRPAEVAFGQRKVLPKVEIAENHPCPGIRGREQ
jgi:hypothetical protein